MINDVKVKTSGNWLCAGKADNIAAALRENAWNLQRFFGKLGKTNN